MDRGPSIVTKYVIRAGFEIEGVVEKTDVIGAIFGQTEGLFGPELDLRELQKNGRIGRIEVDLTTKQDRTTGKISIPTTLDRVSVALIAAAVESIDRIGPCTAKVSLERIEDVRETKRKLIIERARGILRDWNIESITSVETIMKELSEGSRALGVEEFGPDSLPSGPEVGSSSSIIIVEGRADVINLLRCGIKNVIAIEGVKIPETIIKLTREKREVTAFLDGDHGGDLILKELLQVAKVDYVARAPAGKEVEELTPKDVLKALRDKVPVRGVKESPMGVPPPLIDAFHELKDTLEAVLFNEKGEAIARLPVSELAEKLPSFERPYAVVFDGIITQRLVDVAGEKGVKLLLGVRMSEITKKPPQLQLMTAADLGGS
ncbi:MAG: DNA primase DnaG [Candidatus Bathyarchaeia archaeon]